MDNMFGFVWVMLLDVFQVMLFVLLVLVVFIVKSESDKLVVFNDL